MQTIDTKLNDSIPASSCCGSHVVPAPGAAAWRCKGCGLLCAIDPNASRKDKKMFHSLRDEDYSEQNATAPYEGDVVHAQPIKIDMNVVYELTEEDAECVS